MTHQTRATRQVINSYVYTLPTCFCLQLARPNENVLQVHVSLSGQIASVQNFYVIT